MTIEFEHAIGDTVLIQQIERMGRVTAVMQDSTGPQYLVVFWDNGDRKSFWLFPFEVERVAKP